MSVNGEYIEDENVRSLDERIDDIMMKINGNGFFATFSFSILVIQTMANGFSLSMLPFLLLMPAFLCNQVGSTETFSCIEKDFCNVIGI